MTTSSSKAPTKAKSSRSGKRNTKKKDMSDVMSDHLDVLRQYATRVIKSGEALTEDEEVDRNTRFREYADIGGSFKLTESEMVGLVYRGLFANSVRCGCPQCNSRNST